MMYVFLRGIFAPPALQILLLLISALLAYRGHRVLARSVWALSLMSLWLMATPLGAGFLARGLEIYAPLPVRSELTAHHWQAIVVLGGGRASAVEYGQDAPNVWTASRLRYAAFLYRQSGLPIAVSGGVGRDEPAGTAAEAAVMAASLIRDHVANVQWQENTSTTTWENAQNIRRLLSDEGIERVVLVTQAQHMPRAVLAFTHAGFTVLPAPIDFAPNEARLPWPQRLLPSAKYLLLAAQSCHEYAGLVWYRVKIWLG